MLFASDALMLFPNERSYLDRGRDRARITGPLVDRPRRDRRGARRDRGGASTHLDDAKAPARSDRAAVRRDRRCARFGIHALARALGESGGDPAARLGRFCQAPRAHRAARRNSGAAQAGRRRPAPGQRAGGRGLVRGPPRGLPERSGALFRRSAAASPPGRSERHHQRGAGGRAPLSAGLEGADRGRQRFPPGRAPRGRGAARAPGPANRPERQLPVVRSGLGLPGGEAVRPRDARLPRAAVEGARLRGRQAVVSLRALPRLQHARRQERAALAARTGVVEPPHARPVRRARADAGVLHVPARAGRCGRQRRTLLRARALADHALLRSGYRVQHRAGEQVPGVAQRDPRVRAGHARHGRARHAGDEDRRGAAAGSTRRQGSDSISPLGLSRYEAEQDVPGRGSARSR